MRNRLIELMGEKQAREGRVINANIVARETNLPRQVISKWVRGEIKHLDAEKIELFCNYFECDLPDLLYLEKKKNDQ